MNPEDCMHFITENESGEAWGFPYTHQICTCNIQARCKCEECDGNGNLIEEETEEE